MATRETAPTGAPCWTDLWTSDVEGSRHFYAELFGWEAQEPSPEFGGYWMFHRGGVPVAGGMGGMPGVPAQNRWSVYLQTDDIAGLLERATSQGATVVAGPQPVADLGIQAVLDHPAGGHVGAWQAGIFPGFTVLDEPGAPTWFELFSLDYGAAVAFYRDVFRWKTNVVGDGDEFRYTTLQPGDEGLAGIMDAGSFLPSGTPAYWSVYWLTDDVDASIASVLRLGGSVVAAPADSPYGRIATVADPAGAEFKLRAIPVDQ